MNKLLALADLDGNTQEEIKSHVINQYHASDAEMAKMEFLIAYESVGSWGCDSSSYFLVRNTETGELFENFGSHCSCHGFEDQWKPEKVTVEFLQSRESLYFTGGYDEDSGVNTKKVLEYFKGLDK